MRISNNSFSSNKIFSSSSLSSSYFYHVLVAAVAVYIACDALGYFRCALAVGAFASCSASSLAHLRKHPDPHQPLTTHTFILQASLIALRLHTTLILPPVSLNHKAYLVRLLWHDLIKELSHKTYNMTYNRCPQAIKGVTLCLAHTMYKILTGAHAIYAFAFSHPPHQASHLSILSLRPHSLIQFITTSWGHFTNTPVATHRPHAFSRTECIKHHTMALRFFSTFAVAW